MFFIKLTPRENTKLLNYCVIIKYYYQWASLNYEFENSISRGRASHHFLQLVNHLFPEPPSQYLCLLDLSEYLSLEIQEVDSEKVNLGFLQVHLMIV